MLIITERWVLKKISKLRNHKSKKDEKLNQEEADKCLTYRKVRGVEREIFSYYLINGLKPYRRWRYKFFWVLKHLDFYKGGKKIIVINDIIDSALKKEYLYPFDYCKDEDFDRLKLTKEGYHYISHFYYMMMFCK